MNGCPRVAGPLWGIPRAGQNPAYRAPWHISPAAKHEAGILPFAGAIMRAINHGGTYEDSLDIRRAACRQCLVNAGPNAGASRNAAAARSGAERQQIGRA